MDNRRRYLQLLDSYEITQARSIELFAAVTERPCAVRTVRSWVNDPEKPSSVPYPDWAVTVLEKAIYLERALALRSEVNARKAPSNPGKSLRTTGP